MDICTKEKGITVVHVISSSKFAIKSEEAGCDAVVAEVLKPEDTMEEKKRQQWF
jgi:hypothetical protein